MREKIPREMTREDTTPPTELLKSVVKKKKIAENATAPKYIRPRDLNIATALPSVKASTKSAVRPNITPKPTAMSAVIPITAEIHLASVCFHLFLERPIRFLSKPHLCSAFADDSGLEVAVLGGRPGVYSSRYAGYNAEDWANNQKMLEELCIADVEESPANYRCSLCFVDTDGTLLTSDGRCDGVVKKIPRGKNGFGYDPYFYTNEYAGRTMAELTLEEKTRISHRGRALRKLTQKLEEHLA